MASNYQLFCHGDSCFIPARWRLTVSKNKISQIKLAKLKKEHKPERYSKTCNSEVVVTRESSWDNWCLSLCPTGFNCFLAHCKTGVCAFLCAHVPTAVLWNYTLDPWSWKEQLELHTFNYLCMKTAKPYGVVAQKNRGLKCTPVPSCLHLIYNCVIYYKSCVQGEPTPLCSWRPAFSKFNNIFHKATKSLTNVIRLSLMRVTAWIKNKSDTNFCYEQTDVSAASVDALSSNILKLFLHSSEHVRRGIKTQEFHGVLTNKRTSCNTEMLHQLKLTGSENYTMHFNGGNAIAQLSELDFIPFNIYSAKKSWEQIYINNM